MYDDGTYKKVEHGIALDIMSNETAVLDCINCSEANLQNAMNALINLGLQKGWL